MNTFAPEVIELREWETIQPEKGNLLYNRFLESENEREIAAVLNEKGIIEITELRNGLKITANSFVGQINLGKLQINVLPKLNGLPLYRILKYTYGLRDMELFPEALYDISRFPFYDLLIYQLRAEAEEIIARGLNKKYVQIANEIQVPRGRIDLKKIAHKGGMISANLPCLYFERIEDNLLNRVLLAGLRLGISLTEDLNLKIKLNSLCQFLKEAVTEIQLTKEILDRAQRTIDRLSENYRTVIELIKILFQSQGIQMEDGLYRRSLPGFFFDMNWLFQEFISKLLHDFLDDYEIRDEYRLHGLFTYTAKDNPKNRRAPTPRPDFAILYKGKVKYLLDAKYRDLWENPLPREMLYQLAIYAISGKGDNASKILYPAMDTAAKVQKIDIMNPVNGEKLGQVILQPVLLLKVADYLVDVDKQRKELSQYIAEIVLN